MKTLVPKHIIAVSMMVVAAAAPTGMASQNDGRTAAQDDSRKKIITESTLQEFRIFTAKDGKTVRGRILAYSQNKGTVTIAKKNGRASLVDLNTLSKDDQTYVREWHRIKDFFSQDRFHISVRKKWGGAGAEYLIWKSEETIVYEIRLENLGSYDLNGLTLDYCIYHEQEELNYRGQVVIQGVKSGTRNIGTLARGKKARFETEPVVFPKEGQFEYYKGNKVSQGKILGIWIRIYLPLESGKKAMREFASPSSLMSTRKWVSLDAQTQ